jgi:hypothetical protein
MDNNHGGDGHDDQMLGLKRRKRQAKNSRQRYKWLGVFLVWLLRHLASVITFRIDSRTIKRGEIRI